MTIQARYSPGLAKLSTTAAIRLLVLTLLQKPEITVRYPYPLRNGKHVYDSYYQAYQDNQGWTGSEIQQLVNTILDTRWKANPDLIFNRVLGHLERHSLVRARREDSGRPGWNRVWYSLVNDPHGDPSRPINVMIERDKMELRPQLADAKKFIERIEAFVYGQQ